MTRRVAAVTVLVVAAAACDSRSPRGLSPREGYIAVRGGRVWYRIVGSGTRTPLLVLHGGPGVPSTYLKPLAALADERPVVFYDQLGSGHSEHPVDSALWTMQRFLVELAEVRRALGLTEVHLYGHSWGALLATDYVLSHPAGVKSLILAGPALDVRRYERDDDSLVATLPASVRAVLARHEADGTCTAPDYQAAMAVYFQHFFARRQPWSVDLDSAVGGFDQTARRVMWGPCRPATGPLAAYDRSDRLGEITVPTLFLIGADDPATPATTRFYQSRIPGSELVVFDSTGHLPMQDEPERYVTTIGGFLDRVDAARAAVR
ncbi:MAG TPA: proline iminopeptidase-family hydrolase [Gemmatimonadales bacterium]